MIHPFSSNSEARRRAVIPTLGRWLGFFLVILSLGGCDSLSRTQYVVAKASYADQAAIKKIVRATGMKAKLVDKTSESRAPHTLIYFAEPVPHFPIELGARMVGDTAVLDLNCFHPGPGKTPLFKSLEAELTPAMDRQFGTRVTMPDYKNLLP